MSKKTTPAKAAAPAIVKASVVKQNEGEQSAVESTPTASESNPTDALATEVATEVADTKRARNYSQTAIDVADLERLNQLKTFVKEKLKVTVSNQRIIAAALDCLGENVEAFLKNLTDEASNKALAKERKAYEVLKAKFEAGEATTLVEIKTELDAAEAPAA